MSKDTREINMIDANKHANEPNDVSVNNIMCETKSEGVNKMMAETNDTGVNNKTDETNSDSVNKCPYETNGGSVNNHGHETNGTSVNNRVDKTNEPSVSNIRFETTRYWERVLKMEKELEEKIEKVSKWKFCLFALTAGYRMGAAGPCIFHVACPVANAVATGIMSGFPRLRLGIEKPIS